MDINTNINNTNNSTITHGLLLEDFKQNMFNLIQQHALDIQSKALVLDYMNIQIQSLSAQQNRKELDKYKASLESVKTTETDSELKEEISNGNN